jgi:hypothetical protein
MTGNFPTVPVDDLVIHPRDNDLVVGTHGRSIYILDDVTPLEQLTSDMLESEVHLFGIRSAYAYLPWKHESYSAQRQFIGENPPHGALITYYLGTEPDDGVDLLILDGEGNTLREMEGSKQEGMNRVVWDMRNAPPEGVPGASGPIVPPGSYTVRLVVGEERFDESVEVKVDPRVDITAAELLERYSFLTDVGTMVAEIHKASESSEKIIDQIEKFLKGEGVPETLQTAANEVLEKAKQIRLQLVGPGGRASFRNPSLQRNIGSLASELEGGGVRQGTFHGPRKAQKERFAEYKSEAEEQLGRLNQLIETSIPDLNRRIAEAGLPWIKVQ